MTVLKRMGVKLSFSTSCILGTALSLNLFPESRGPFKKLPHMRAIFCSAENLHKISTKIQGQQTLIQTKIQQKILKRKCQNKTLTGRPWSKWSRQMVAGCPQRLLVVERSQHFFYHPLCHQSYWCLYHRSALAQLEPQLGHKSRERERERESWSKKGGKGGGGAN